MLGISSCFGRLSLVAGLVITSETSPLLAQTVPVAPQPSGYVVVPAPSTPLPPPGYPPAPPGYVYVPQTPLPMTPPGYPPAPAGYKYVPIPTAPPPGYQPALELPYDPGKPIPMGYHLHEEPRRGLIVGGYILTGISYGIVATAAMSADFRNATSYLFLPFLGPWLTLGRRSYSNCTKGIESSKEWGCAADALVVTFLAMDGLMQAGGGAMLLTGYLSTRKKLVRNSTAWTVTPSLIGAGYGLSVQGIF